MSGAASLRYLLGGFDFDGHLDGLLVQFTL